MKLSRPQFSVRTLAIVVTVVCAYLGAGDVEAETSIDLTIDQLESCAAKRIDFFEGELLPEVRPAIGNRVKIVGYLFPMEEKRVALKFTLQKNWFIYDHRRPVVETIAVTLRKPLDYGYGAYTVEGKLGLLTSEWQGRQVTSFVLTDAVATKIERQKRKSPPATEP